MIEIMLLLLTYNDIFNYDDSLVIANSLDLINVE